MSDDAGANQPANSISLGKNCIIFASIIACLGVSWPFGGFGLIHFVHGIMLKPTSEFIFFSCLFVTPFCGLVCFILLVYKTWRKSSRQSIKAELIMIIICLALGFFAAWLAYLFINPHTVGLALRGKVSIDQEEALAWMKDQNITLSSDDPKPTIAMLPPSLSKLNPEHIWWIPGIDVGDDRYYLRLSWMNISATEFGFFIGHSDMPFPDSPYYNVTCIEIAPGFWAF